MLFKEILLAKKILGKKKKKRLKLTEIPYSLLLTAC